MRLNILYPALSLRPSVHASLVADHFGLTPGTSPHVVADELDLTIAPASIVAFTGPSGSGKSSLLRAAAAELEQAGGSVVRADALALPDASLIDALGLPFESAIGLLSRCGLAEPRLMLRRPCELSDGERWRFRLALALARKPNWIVLDEFTAALDRTLAKIVAFNVRRPCDRTGTGFLIATCHDDVIADLAPDEHVICEHDGVVRGQGPGTRGQGFEAAASECEEGRPPLAATRLSTSGLSLSFADELSMTIGSLADWPRFARWHYRSHRVGSVRFVTVLWHREQQIGICVFTTPPLSLAGRHRYFGRSGKWTRLTIGSVNRQLATLSRVVLHPTYRGAGVAAAFVRQSCELCPYPWIESLAQMGRINPFFEKAGFVRIDVPARPRGERDGHSAIYGTPSRRTGKKTDKRLVTPDMHSKSRYAEPVYYVFDNRQKREAKRNELPSPSGEGPGVRGQR
ncbi:MAG: ATP-binding cassette domain-containing protein [Planctomycetota bacterium]|nr:ATP-binding cassette domain-containing protein [Planctomycetota bacterium]